MHGRLPHRRLVAVHLMIAKKRRCLSCERQQWAKQGKRRWRSREGGGNTQGKVSVFAVKACSGKVSVLAAKAGSGNTRQRRCLSREDMQWRRHRLSRGDMQWRRRCRSREGVQWRSRCLTTCRMASPCFSGSEPPRANVSASGVEGWQRRTDEGCAETSPSPAGSRRRDCHFADIPSPSLLKRLLKGEGMSAK